MTSQTFQTLAPPELTQFLETMAKLVSAAERQMYRDLQSGRDAAELRREYQKIFGLNSRQVGSIYIALKGKIASRQECHKRQIEQIENQISDLTKAIKKLRHQLKTTYPTCSLKFGSKTPRQLLKWKIHQKKRKLASLKVKLERVKAVKPKLIFGSRKLWNVQYNLEVNGYANHQEWVKDWQSARESQLVFVGSKSETGGCSICQLDELGHIKIRVPQCLEAAFGEYVEADGVQFPYGQKTINYALNAPQALTYRFVRKGDVWYIFCTTDRPEVPYQSHRRNGMIGVDLNPGVVGWAYCDVEGNLKAKGQFKVNLQDRSRHQTKAAIGSICAQLVTLAETFACPITVETLDFSRKKAGMKEQGVRYSRMLSNFAYDQFDSMLSGRCENRGIELIHVNPAYSSWIGLVKFMSMYGLSSDTAAALVLARRALRKSERIPANYASCLPVDKHKHVWSFWNAFGKKLKGLRRHQFFTTRGANSAIEVILFDEPKPKRLGRSTRKPKGTSIPRRDSLAQIVDDPKESACLG